MMTTCRTLLSFITAAAGLLMGQAAQGQTQADCLQGSADHFQVPMDLVKAILKTEGGRPGQAVRNTNGSHDLGPMQINTSWLPILAARGITLPMLRDDYCVNVAVGTWILAREMQRLPMRPRSGEVWQAIAGYHSHTPQHNTRYAILLWRQLKAGQGSGSK